MDCATIGKCCIHAQSNVENDASPKLVTVSLDVNDIETALEKLGKLTEEDISREIDAVSGRLKMAEYITKALTNRIQTLNSILSHLRSSVTSDSSGSRPDTPLDGNDAPSTAQALVSKPSRPMPPPLIRRHTTIATPTTREMAAGGWEERAAAFMMKRRSQQSAREQGDASLHQSPPLSPSRQRFPNPVPRWSMQSSEQRPGPHRLPSDQSELEVRDTLWEYERRNPDPRRRELISVGFSRYQEAWEEIGQHLLKSRIEPYLTFATVPWPIFRLSSEPVISSHHDITVESVREFILSPFHSTDKGKESRVREAYLRWDLDKSTKWFDLVQPVEKAKVLQGIDKVNRCLDHLK